MFFFLGFLGLVQAMFLPGYIFYRFACVHLGVVESLSVSFGLSLVVNYIFVFSFAALHLYTRGAVFAVLLLELGLLACLALRDFKKEPPISKSHLSAFRSSPLDASLYSRAGVIMLLVFLLSCFLSFQKIGNIFTATDAIFSWNRWAFDWYSNKLAQNTWNYPQLLPISWSLIYVVTGTPHIQFFSYAFSLMFLPMLFFSNFIPYVNGLRAYAVCLSLLYLMFLPFLSAMPVGFADVPVASVMALSLNCLMVSLYSCRSQKVRYQYLVLSCVFAACSATLKQSGLYWFFAYFALLAFMPLKERLELTPQMRKIFFAAVVSSALLVFPWYAYARYLIFTGASASEISWVTEGIHQGLSYFQRLQNALVRDSLITIALFLSLPAIFCRRFFIVPFVGVLYTLLWGIFLSYDVRNAVPAIPLLAASTAFWISNVAVNRSGFLFSFFSKSENLQRIIKNKSLWVPLASVACVLCLNLFFNNTRLTIAQLEQQIEIGNQGVNRMFLSAFNEDHTGDVVSDYQFLMGLPGVGYAKFQYCDLSRIDSPVVQAGFKLLLSKDATKYILVPDAVLSKAVAFLEEWYPHKRYIRVNGSDGYTLLKLS